MAVHRPPYYENIVKTRPVPRDLFDLSDPTKPAQHRPRPHSRQREPGPPYGALGLACCPVSQWIAASAPR